MRKDLTDKKISNEATSSSPMGIDGPEVFDAHRRIQSIIRLVPEDDRRFPGFLLRPSDETGETVDLIPEYYEDSPSFAHVDLTNLDLRGVRDIETIPGLYNADTTGVRLTTQQIHKLLKENPAAFEKFVKDNWHWRTSEDYGRYKPIDLTGIDAKDLDIYDLGGAFSNMDLTGVKNLEEVKNIQCLWLTGAKLSKDQLEKLASRAPKAFQNWTIHNRFAGLPIGAVVEADCVAPGFRNWLREYQCLYGLDLTKVKNIDQWPSFHNCDVRQVKLSNTQLRELFIKYPSSFSHYLDANPQIKRSEIDFSGLDLRGAERQVYDIQELDLRGALNIEHSKIEFYSSGKTLLTEAQLSALGRVRPESLLQLRAANPVQSNLDGLNATMIDFRGMNLEGLDLTKVDHLERGEELERADLKGAHLSPQQLAGLFIHQPLAFTKYRNDNPHVTINLNGLDLRGVTLHRQDMSGLDLRAVRHIEEADIRLINSAIITPEQQKLIGAAMHRHGMEVIFAQLGYEVQPLRVLPQQKMKRLGKSL